MKYSITYIAICGSHIDSVQRLCGLRTMIKSWATQTVSVDLIVSLTYEKNMAELVFSEMQYLDDIPLPEDRNLNVFAEFGKKSQFEHFQKIVDMCNADMDPYTTWVITTDDDDIWHPRRAELLSNLAISIHHQGDKMCLSGRICNHAYGDVPKARAAADIDVAIKTGQMDVINELSIRNELWMYVFRLATLADFIQKANARLLNHVYCDMFFRKYLCNSKYRTAVYDLPQTTWLYAYRGLGKKVPRATSYDTNPLKGLSDNIVLGWSYKFTKDEVMEFVMQRQPKRDYHSIKNMANKLIAAGLYKDFENSPMPPPIV